MSRSKTPRTTPELLDKLLSDYYNLDIQIKSLTEQKDPLNKAIKHIMKECRLNSHIAKELKAEYHLHIRRTLHVEKVLERLKSLGVDPETVPEFWKSNEIEVLSVKKH